MKSFYLLTEQEKTTWNLFVMNHVSVLLLFFIPLNLRAARGAEIVKRKTNRWRASLDCD